MLFAVLSVVSEEKMFKNVDGRKTNGWTPDTGIISILLVHIEVFINNKQQINNKVNALKGKSMI